MSIDIFANTPSVMKAFYNGQLRAFSKAGSGRPDPEFCGGSVNCVVDGCVFRNSVTDDFGVVTGGFGNVTGHFGAVTGTNS